MNPSEGGARLGTAGRRAAGLLLVLAAYAPLHRLLDPTRAGPAAAATRDVGAALWGLSLWGTILAAAAALLLARYAPVIRLPPAWPSRAAAARAHPRVVAGVCALVALAGSAAAARLLFLGLPTLADAMVQLLDARAWAAGRLGAPLPDPAAARLVQNGVATARGWVSVYPPGHTVPLAAGLAAGAAWLVGPLLTGATAGITALCARRLLPERPGAALLGAALVALSPFVLLIGGGYLSHTSAAAAAALALYCALRARDGSPAWAAAAGLAVGWLTLTRPWTGITLGPALTAGVWWAGGLRAGALARRLAWWGGGGAPAALALALYDARFFGHPARLGYQVAFGPAHGLGLHRDPWGAAYGATEALAYSGFDLMALGVHLLETPVSAVGLIGLWLMAARVLPRGAGVLLAWALVPVLANAAYWHHGYHLGPRMLYEAAPAWCLLAALAVVELGAAPGWSGRAALWLAVLALGAGAVLQLPRRIEASRWSPDAVARATPPVAPRGDATAVVFVHGSWPARVAARLAGAGMRRDSVETALRRNDLCLAHRLADRMEAGDSDRSALDFEPLPGSPPRLRALELTPGTFARVDPSVPPVPECAREARADRFGTLELEPLLWRTPLPGVEEGLLLYRDLGPAANARVLERHPEASAWLLLPEGGSGGLLPYGDGMAALWSERAEEGKD